MTVAMTLSAIAPFAPPPTNEVLATLAQVCITIADLLK